MLKNKRFICRFCYTENSGDGLNCVQCGRDLCENPDLPRQRCIVVPHGSRYGIMHETDVKINGLSLENAQALATLMNEALQDEIPGNISIPARAAIAKAGKR